MMFNDSPVYEKLFSISRNGVFHAEKPLENGSYEIEVICKLNGEEEEFTLGIDVGIWIDASIPLATYKGSAANNYTYSIDAGGCAVKACLLYTSTPLRWRLEESTRSVIAALNKPIASRIVVVPEPLAPINTLTLPGSKAA